MMLKWKTALFIVVVIALTAACGASTQQYDTSRPAATHYQTGGDDLARAQVASESVQASSSGPASSGPGSTREPAAAADPRVDYDRKFVKTAWVELEVDDEDDLEPTVARVREVADGLGGYAVEMSSSSISVKVPTERLDEAMVAIASIAEVTDRNVRVSDVTARYVDMQIRIANLEQIRARLQELVEQGEDVKAILEVEKELNRVTRELESMKGQMRMLTNQVTFATIHVDVSEDVTPGPIGWIFYGGYKAVKWLFVWD